MKKYPHLKNAPISECLIDFRVKFESEIHAEIFKSLESKLKNEYPNVEKLRRFETRLEIDKEGKGVFHSNKDLGLEGFIFKSKDNNSLAQFRINGFTFNKLKPYTEWGEIITEARRLCEEYVNIAKPKYITRLATRYINHIKIEKSLIDISEYLTAPPLLPSELKFKLSSFLSKNVIHDSETSISANITQGFEEDISKNFFRLILDIDCYIVTEIDPLSDNIWTSFEELRNMKNRIFFSSLKKGKLEELK